MDPAFLSTVVIIDTGVGGAALRRLTSSVVALSSDFVTDFDEAAVYRFNNTVDKVSEFTKDQKYFEHNMDVIAKIAANKGETNGQPLVIAPGKGPKWLRWLLDRGNAPRPLYDALFAAAGEMEKRPEENRKIIVVISDGQIAQAPGSGLNPITPDQARDRLVKDKVQVYGVTLGIGVLGGATSVLQSYADFTGGDVYDGRSQSSMENAFAAIGEQSRYEYVLSYVSNNELVGPMPVVRNIEVKTTNPVLKIHHRKTYLQYPTRQ